ncbi:MAG TPA: MBL fold metallo-hydrolase [Solirubrobacteraceae bacterium]|nr:MBL fold metallo-hydrolase [Solirubrobacteraceae bacterium]
MDARIVDLRYDGRPGTVGAWLCDDVLIDCGPGSGLPQLLDGLGDRPPRALMLTHVHLDHAGAAGALVERWPQLPVYVHPIGIPHLADPSRLVASTRRVFGGRLEELLGEVLPVPQENLHAIDDGQQIGALRCAWTPGHASHHVAFLEPESGLAFCGDLAGVCLEGDVVVPPTPPPEVDLDAWRSSLGRLERWRPRALALAHYGLVDAPAEHIAAMGEALSRHERWAAAGEEAFLASLESYLRERLPGPVVEDYMFVALAGPSAAGLRRWLERSAAARSEPSPAGADTR